MAREQRRDVDYFPHDCRHGRKMHIIETKYGNDGYALWFKLLEQLGKANNHYIDINDEMTFYYLVATFKISEEKTKEILDDLVKIGAIDRFLYEEHKIIWSQKFIDSIDDAYRKRKNKIFKYSDILKEIGAFPAQSGGGLTPETTNTEEENHKEEDSIEKDNKEEDIKEEEKKFDNSKNIQFGKVLKESEDWKNTIEIQYSISTDKIEKLIDEFVVHLGTSFIYHPNKTEFAKHFKNWFTKPKTNKIYGQSTGPSRNRNR